MATTDLRLNTSPGKGGIDDEESILGVAISRHQTRLTSPTTPASEKLRALRDGDEFADSTQTAPSHRLSSSTKHTKSRSADLRAFLNDGFSRPRASSGPDSSLESIQKAIRSLPKKLSISSPFSSDKRQEEESVDSSHSTLRRTNSDQSLNLIRSLSLAPSLGDDSRFAEVGAQVNSRFKAIKDTIQDANIRLPSMPSITSFRSDIFGSKEPPDPMTRQPYSSVAEAAKDLDVKDNTPHLNLALTQLKGDVVVLGGYRGSILRSSTPPNKQLWVPIKVGLNLRKVDLEVGIADEDDLRPPDDIIADGMLTHIGPVDISRRLFKRLRTSINAQNGALRVHDYGYDWRLDPNFLSKQLCEFLEKLSCAQAEGATVIAHSLGGLITRHAVNARPELFKRVIYAGVPTRCVNILGPLRNGDDVLLSSRVLTAQVNFTIRTSFALLPLDGKCFIDKHTREQYDVDFFDPRTWLDQRLSPCIARPLRPLVTSNGISGYVSTVTKALPSLPISARKFSLSRKDGPSITSAGGIAEPDSMGSSQPAESGDPSEMIEPTVSTAVTIPFKDAYAYLSRMLANVKRFKQELEYRPENEHKYPPVAVIYGKNTPTVYGARVDGKDGIKRADAYDDLAFASGDGVVLARAAMLPDGYRAARGGIIPSERGHVSLLGDLEAVGRALNAVIAVGRERDMSEQSHGSTATPESEQRAAIA